jgi:hypothetical protein
MTPRHKKRISEGQRKAWRRVKRQIPLGQRTSYQNKRKQRAA